MSEYEKYESLKDSGLAQFVAETIYYKTYQGFRIFCQEKVISIYDCESSDHDKYFTRLKNSSLITFKDIILSNKEYSNFNNLDSEWFEICIDYYGQDSVESFLNYCLDIDPDITNDLHPRNYGFRKNGEPAILDFSDYHD